MNRRRHEEHLVNEKINKTYYGYDNKISCVGFIFIKFLNVSVVEVRHDSQSSEDDTRIQNIMTNLLDIGIYKEIVKLNKQLRNEIAWIVEESKGPRERKRIIELLKQDVKGKINHDEKSRLTLRGGIRCVSTIHTCAAERYKDCTEMKNKSNRKTESGVYTIYPDGKKSAQGYCDMSTDGGGNHFVHTLTSSGKYELRIDLIISNTKKYAVYKRFSIGDAALKYKLNVGDFQETQGINLFIIMDICLVLKTRTMTHGQSIVPLFIKDLGGITTVIVQT
ncbi:TN [Mytilus edulis]|uniref:TN n=1 Tax=Mytilus edulis TaxID=6550 RepID=A0A8S3TXD2_MYTED|nr:TN [Mytilus edulis]